MIKVAIEDLEKNIPFILKHIEAGDSFLILRGQKPDVIYRYFLSGN